METKMMETKMMGMSGMPAMGNSGMGSMMMVPRCTMKMEKCEGGMTVMCTSMDPMSVSMMQNLCSMMAGGMTSMCMMMNGMMVMNCCMTMGTCRYEMMTDGMMMTCTSGDTMACKMIQACCDCMMTMMECGCACYMCMNNMPICCC